MKIATLKKKKQFREQSFEHILNQKLKHLLFIVNGAFRVSMFKIYLTNAHYFHIFSKHFRQMLNVKSPRNNAIPSISFKNLSFITNFQVKQASNF